MTLLATSPTQLDRGSGLKQNRVAHRAAVGASLPRRSSMPYLVREKVKRVLNHPKRSICGAKVLLLGVVRNGDVNDRWESPARRVMNLLERDGVQVEYHDPAIRSFVDRRGRTRRSLALTDEALRGADCIVILADRASIEWGRILTQGRRIVDTRSVIRGIVQCPEHMVRS